MRVTLTAAMVLSLTVAMSQVTDVNIQQVIDARMGSLELPSDEAYENLLYLLSQPLDLNQATADELHFHLLLTENQIQNLLSYREENGHLLSVYELQSIPEFDSATIQQIMPFVVVKEPTSLKNTARNTLAKGKHLALFQYERTVQPRAGINGTNVSNRFLGSPDRLLFRLRTNDPGNYSLGITLEKDVGEPMAFNLSKGSLGFDFSSFHIQLQNRGRIQNLLVGDYQAQFGQGLNLGGLFGLGKGGEVVSFLRKSNLGALPYTSTLEGGQYRGVFTTLRLSQAITISTLLSRVGRDALVSDSTEQAASSLPTSGYHRTQTELDRKNKIKHGTLGAIISYKQGRADAGVILNHTRLSKELIPNPTLYNQFNFKGRTNTNASFYYGYNIRNISLFGELAHSLTKGSAVLIGAQSSLSRAFDIGLVYREYDSDYTSFFSNALSEGSHPQNERGLYQSFRYRWKKKVLLGVYFDLFEFPWLRYRTYAPSSGHEWLARLDIQLAREASLYVQLREERKERNVFSDTHKTVQVSPGTKLSGIVNYVNRIESIQLHTRIQFSHYTLDGTSTQGLALIHDTGYKHGNLFLTWRIAMFDTDDYENRQYVYEEDVYMSFSLPAYYGRGIRNNLLVRYRPLSWMTIGVRISHTQYPGVGEIGSGLDRINGDQRTDIKFQMAVRP